MTDAQSGGPIIRPATGNDAEAIWRIFHAVVAPGDTYAFAEDTPRETAVEYFLAPDVVAFVGEIEGQVVGMYKLIPNRLDRGSHVANASFMVDPAQKGRGIGRALGRHCLAEAWARGYRSMQFNFVVSTNTRAVRLWQGLGFAIVGTLPKAFQHRDLGYVDAYVMHRSLDDLSGGREAAFPLFGGREDDDPYAVRPCAYAIVVNEHGQIAVVRSGEGVFLPGGGMDAEESPEQAAVRETLEECAIDIRVTSLVGRAAHIVLAGNAAARVEKRSTFFAAVRVSSLDRAPEHEVSWLAPAEATAEITRTVHAWAVQRWLDLGRGGCPA